MFSRIKSVKAREILDSRGNPTVEVEVVLGNGIKAWAGVPSGASTGSHEARESRDGDQRRYHGRGVLLAVNNVNRKIAPRIVGLNPAKQRAIDQLMIDLDGTDNKSKLGANAILGVSLAVARAAAITQRRPLYAQLRRQFWPENKTWKFPQPTMNILNGGAHAGWSVDLQEFMVVPQQANVKKAIQCGAEIFRSLGDILRRRGDAVTVGDEGGYAPKLAGNETALRLIMEAIKTAGYKAGSEVKLALDAAASEFYREGKYQMPADGKTRTGQQLIALYRKWLARYPLESLEDGLAEDDWAGWEELTKQLGAKTVLVGDDLFVTNTARIKEGINRQVANAVLIKLNQIGTVSETAAAIKLAQKHKYKISISHRSGETVDDFIADLAVAAGADYLKAGSLSRGERVAKYNRLMEIWDEVKS